MKKLLALAAFSGTLLLSQTPDLSGVWRADLTKSKRQGPPVVTYLVMIEQKNAVFNNRTKEEALQISETTGTWGQRGEQRTVLAFFVNGKPKVGSYSGIPTELTGSVDGGKVVVKAEQAGGGSSFTRTYELSADGKTLTMNEDGTNEGRPMHSTIVMDKQDQSAAEPLTKPEEVASVHYKNVKTDALKGLPASQFINTMHYFSWSLGKECNFCHVERKFDSDDKKEKQTARKMIDMVAAINEHNFESKPEVKCFTCHEGNGHPLSHQLFADEIQAAKERAAREAADREAHRPPPPAGAPPPSQH